ncbi:MAG: FAD-binding oxidoreductase [Rhodospirillales bacterium]
MDVFGKTPKFEPWWWEAVPRRWRAEPPALPSRADAIVVGGGYTGLSAALALARAGRDVVVIEAETPGFGGSARNAGMIGSGHRVSFGNLEKRYGAGIAEELMREGVRALSFSSGLIEQEGIDCDFRRVGRLRCAWRPQDYETLARDAEILRNKVGIEAEMVPRAEQHREIASDRYHGGCLFPTHGGLHPAKFHQGLWALTETAGARVVAPVRVSAIEGDSGEYTVTTAHGAVRARDVVVATNAYTGPESPGLRRSLMPIASYMFATEPLGANRLRDLIPNDRMIVETRSRTCYYRPLPDDDRLLFGGRAALRHVDPRKSGPILHQLMLSVLPQLGDVKITHSWFGTLGFTMDHLPRVGRDRNGVHYAVGYSGSGVAMAPYLGWRAAQKILGTSEASCAFDKLSVDPVPFRMGLPIALPFVEMWYRLKDWKEGT